MALLPPGTSTGETLTHSDLVGREQPNQHPITAVTGLADILASQDARLLATGPLRYLVAANNQSVVNLPLPEPLDTLSLAVVVIRSADGRQIEPDIQYFYAVTGLSYVQSVRLTFTPAINGDHIVHLVR